MLKKLLFLVIGIPVGIVLVVFAVINRGPVTLMLDPFAAEAGRAALTTSVPLYLLLFGTLVLGVVLGGVASWLGTGRLRRTARRARAEAQMLRGEIDRLRGAQPEPLPTALPKPRRTAA